MLKSPINFLRHILDECNFIISIYDQIADYDNFISNDILKRAVVRSLEIIGEASKNITVDDKLKWNTITWKEMAGMRDKLIHDYIGINYKIVWDVAINRIPNLRHQIENVIKNENDNISI